MWLPNAVLVTGLLRFRPRDWPFVYAAGLPAEVIGDLPFQMPPYQALCLGAVNAIEATLFVLFAVLIAGRRRNIGLLSVRGASAVILSAVTVPVLTGTVGGAVVESAWIFSTDYLTAWRTWWFGDSLGLLVGVPIGLLLRDTSRSVARRRSARLALGSGGAAVLLFGVAGVLSAAGNAWGAQQIALATAVVLSLTFGAVGAPTAAASTTVLTLIGLASQENLASIPRTQTLLFVVLAAIYVIAAATESADRTMTQLALAKSDLRSANQRLASLLEAAPDALIIVGPDGRIMLANAQTDRLFGYPREELVGSKVELLLPPRFQDKHIQQRMNYFADPTVRPMGTGLEMWGLHKNGTEFPVSISLSPLHTGPNWQVLAAIRDITDRRENEQRLRRQHDELVQSQQQLQRTARFDSLTGLANRAETLSRLESALSCSRTPGTELGVLFCDVDQFKEINDAWGHAVGDAVLKTVADRIKQCVRHGDTVGRTGGDEMIVLLPSLHSLDEAAQIAESIRRRAAEPIQHSGQTIYATLSIGATLAVPGESVTTTTSRADTAMYKAKQAGRNTVTCV